MSSKLWNRLDQEAAELWTRPRAEVRQQLIVHYMRFAEQLATKRAAKNRRVDPDDVRSEAYAALVKAVDDFDPNNPKGATFSTFAGWRIRGATIEPERQADHVDHKQRAADREIRQLLRDKQIDLNTEEGWELAQSVLPHVGHFADEHTGKKRQENAVPDREAESDERWEALKAEMGRWPEDIREAVQVLLDSGWDVERFIDRVYAADSTVSEGLLWKCGPPDKAVQYLKGVLEFIGADTSICAIGVRVMPPVNETREVSARAETLGMAL